MVNFIIESIVYSLVYLILITFGFYTGEIIIFLLTFGRRKIRWNFYFDLKDSSNKSYLMMECRTWIGIIFWIIIILLLM